MNRGRLLTPDEFETSTYDIDGLESNCQQTLDGENYDWALNIKMKAVTPDGRDFAVGRAMHRVEEEVEVAYAREREDTLEINTSVEFDHQTYFGTWAAVEDGWVIVSDPWVRTVIGHELFHTPTSTSLHLQPILRQFDSPDVYQLGFRGRTLSKGGSKGALYGSHVDQDPDLGEELQHAPLNELGLEHEHRSGVVKAYFAAETAYVEVYDDLDTGEFLDYCASYVLDHVRGQEDDS